MKADLNLFDRAALVLVIIFLGILALRPLLTPGVALAQVPQDHLYIEPGIKMLLSPDRTKKTQGKVVIDLTTGNIWDFQPQQIHPIPSTR